MEITQGLTDEQLVCMFREGNDTAFDSLLQRYESKVYSYLLTALKSEEEAQDMFQDVFMRVVATIKSGRYNDMNKFAAWIMRITHNHVIDYHRRDRSKQMVSDDATEVDVYGSASIADMNNRERELIDRQTLRDVRSLVAMLPENQREVVILRFYEELSFKEIAVKTGVSINTALGRMRYALNNLRRLANEYDVSIAV